MRHIKPRVEETSAWNLFRRQQGFWGRLFRWRTPRAGGGARLPKLELVWLPYFLISFRGRSRVGEDTVTVSVQGHSEGFAVFQMHELLVEGVPQGPHFPPQVTETRATEVGRKELISTLLRVRGVRRSFVPEEIISLEVIQYPYWIYYFERRKGFIDFKTLDAVTGAPAASKIRTAVLSAFCDGSDRLS